MGVRYSRLFRLLSRLDKLVPNFTGIVTVRPV